jgi:hypothetical protein
VLVGVERRGGLGRRGDLMRGTGLMIVPVQPTL